MAGSARGPRSPRTVSHRPERFKIASVETEFRVLRARAAVDLAGEDVDAFLDELGVTGPIDESLAENIADALASHSDAKAEYERIAVEWDHLVWGDSESTVDERLFESSLTERLGVVDALRAAGWTPESMERLAHLLRAPADVGIDPERIYPVGGRQDEMIQYQSTNAAFEEWGVPAANFTE